MTWMRFNAWAHALFLGASAAACAVDSGAPAGEATVDIDAAVPEDAPRLATDGSPYGDGDSSESSVVADAVSDDASEASALTEAATDAAPVVWTTNLGACTPACGATEICEYPHSGGPPDAGCGDGPCPPEVPQCHTCVGADCVPITKACPKQVSCDCLIAACPGGCGPVPFGSCGYVDGQWVVQCGGC